MKRILLFIVGFLVAFAIQAQEVVNIYHSNQTITQLPFTTMDSISFSPDETEIRFHMNDGITSFSTSEIDSLTFEEILFPIVSIHYEDSIAIVRNPFAGNGVEVVVEGTDVTVSATIDKEVEYILTGTTHDGSFKLYGDKKFIITLNGVNLTNPHGAAINIQTGKKATVNLVDGTVNTLTDGSIYALYEEEDMKGTFFSEGQLIISGTGSLEVTGHHLHGICSDDYITIQSGNIYVNTSADTGKGIKCNENLTINGGNITINTTGNTVVENGDPSYCTAFKSDANVYINEGNISVTSKGKGGRGISANGDIHISGGTIQISTSGEGSTYTNASKQKDSYSAACIKADDNVVILDGIISLSSSGSAGKGLSANGTLTIGDEHHSPTLTAKTTGKKITISGSGMNGNYANPKAIKSGGDLIIYNGNIYVSTAQDGGEGIESKTILTINGGTIEAETYDDGINAKSQLIINDGRVYCNASGNDGIDSNGTITINGGLIVTSGSSAPEEGIDCDQNRFSITGGILIASGGATSNPTTNACTQRSLVYNTSSLSGKLLHIQDSSSTDILTYQVPTKSSLNNSVVMLISTPNLQASTSYTIYTAGSVSGEEEFHGYYSHATYTPGTQADSFTTTNMVTTVGKSSGGFPGGGGGGWPGGGGGWPR